MSQPAAERTHAPDRATAAERALGNVRIDLLRCGVRSSGRICLSLVSRNMGSQKLVTYQRITVGLTRDRLDRLGLPDVDPGKVGSWMPRTQRSPTCQRVDRPSRRAGSHGVAEEVLLRTGVSLVCNSTVVS